MSACAATMKDKAHRHRHRYKRRRTLSRKLMYLQQRRDRLVRRLLPFLATPLLHQKRLQCRHDTADRNTRTSSLPGTRHRLQTVTSAFPPRFHSIFFLFLVAAAIFVAATTVVAAAAAVLVFTLATAGSVVVTQLLSALGGADCLHLLEHPRREGIPDPVWE
jgi:hypothetical protein